MRGFRFLMIFLIFSFFNCSRETKDFPLHRVKRICSIEGDQIILDLLENKPVFYLVKVFKSPFMVYKVEKETGKVDSVSLPVLDNGRSTYSVWSEGFLIFFNSLGQFFVWDDMKKEIVRELNLGSNIHFLFRKEDYFFGGNMKDLFVWDTSFALVKKCQLFSTSDTMLWESIPPQIVVTDTFAYFINYITNEVLSLNYRDFKLSHVFVSLDSMSKGKVDVLQRDKGKSVLFTWGIMSFMPVEEYFLVTLNNNKDANYVLVVVSKKTGSIVKEFVYDSPLIFVGKKGKKVYFVQDKVLYSAYFKL